MGDVARVLIVDDDEGIRESLRLVLEDAGYVVTDADSGQRALDVLRGSDERLIILLDNFMPNLDGASFLTTLATDEALFPRHAYVVITASPNALSAETMSFLARTSIPLIHKPFDIEELLIAVEQASQQLLVRRAAARL